MCRTVACASAHVADSFAEFANFARHTTTETLRLGFENGKGDEYGRGGGAWPYLDVAV